MNWACHFPAAARSGCCGSPQTFGKQVRSRHPDLTERQKARVARLEPLAAAFGHAPLPDPGTLNVDSQQRIG